jgi:hypothetical protein
MQLDAPAGIPFAVVEHTYLDVAPQIHEPELVGNSGAEQQTGFIVDHRSLAPMSRFATVRSMSLR